MFDPVRTLGGGRYLLLGRLGQGGMGSVYSAVHRDLEARVAVKVLSERSFQDPTARRRFEREAKTAAGLRSAHVVQIFDYDVDDNGPFIVMELLEGEDLAKRLAGGRRLPPPTALSIVHQVARALEAAARQGIVHRDLKPSNVFLKRCDGEEVVKVLDFGLAKLLGPSREDWTAHGTFVGSLAYASPEQLRAAEVGPQADLWSLAAIAFRMLTGRRPYEARTWQELVWQIGRTDPPRASALEPTLPPTLDAFFARALAREPAERFATARELVEAFACALDLDVSSTSPSDTPEPAHGERVAEAAADLLDVVLDPELWETPPTDRTPPIAAAGGGAAGEDDPLTPSTLNVPTEARRGKLHAHLGVAACALVVLAAGALPWAGPQRGASMATRGIAVCPTTAASAPLAPPPLTPPPASPTAAPSASDPARASTASGTPSQLAKRQPRRPVSTRRPAPPDTDPQAATHGARPGETVHRVWGF
jgi:serine/threonine-protein kinase